MPSEVEAATSLVLATLERAPRLRSGIRIGFKNAALKCREQRHHHSADDEQQPRNLVPAHRLAQIEMREAKREHDLDLRSEEHTSELQSLMRISYAVFCLKKKTTLTQAILYYIIRYPHLKHTSFIIN